MHLGLDAPGLRGPAVAVVPAQVGVDRGVLLGVAPVVGLIEGEPVQGRYKQMLWMSTRGTEAAYPPE